MRPPFAWLGPQVAPFVSHYLAHWSPYRPFWNYEDGCVYKSALDLHAATGERAFYDFVYREVSARTSPEGAIRGFNSDEFNIDNINAGKVFFPLLQTSREDRFRLAIEAQAAQLARHPRTKSGNYWHKKIYPNQVWLDGLYMAQPFQLAYAQLTQKPELGRDTVRQFVRVRDTMRDNATGLFRHGWDESRAQRWADPATGLSPHVWARAMGWFAMALVDCLEHEAALAPGDRKMLADLFGDVAACLLRTRTKANLWQQVIDRPDGEGNYEEASASFMIAYALMKGARLGFLNAQSGEAGFDTLHAGAARFVTQTEVRGICAVAGLGGNPYRDGSYAYYLSEPVVANDPKGVAAFLMALAEGCRRANAVVKT